MKVETFSLNLRRRLHKENQSNIKFLEYKIQKLLYHPKSNKNPDSNLKPIQIYKIKPPQRPYSSNP